METQNTAGADRLACELAGWAKLLEENANAVYPADPAPRPGRDRIKLTHMHGGGYYLTRLSDGAELIFRTDWDAPALASLLGYPVTCCRETDGTVDCPEHGKRANGRGKASRMIAKADSWLFDRDGETFTVDDPGYTWEKNGEPVE